MATPTAAPANTRPSISSFPVMRIVSSPTRHRPGPVQDTRARTMPADVVILAHGGRAAGRSAAPLSPAARPLPPPEPHAGPAGDAVRPAQVAAHGGALRRGRRVRAEPQRA